MMFCYAGYNPCRDAEIVKPFPWLIQKIPYLAIQVRIKLCFCIYPQVDFLPDKIYWDMAIRTGIVIFVSLLKTDPVSKLNSFNIVAIGKIDIKPVGFTV